PCPAATARAFIATDASPFNPYAHARVRCVSLPLDPLDPQSLPPQNPSTLARRSPVSSLLCGNTERTPSGFPMPSGVALPDRNVQAAEQTAHPSAVCAAGRVSAQIAALKSTKSPLLPPFRARHPQHPSASVRRQYARCAIELHRY